MLDSALYKYAGSRWLENTRLLDLAWRTGRFAAASGLGNLMPQHAGYEHFFCEFNEGHQFSLGGAGLYPGVSGNSLAAESIPLVTATANATAPNLNHLFYWGRNNIGTPTTIAFWSDRSLGTDNELHSSVKLGCSDIGHGISVYQPLHSLGLSIGNLAKEFGQVHRVRKLPNVAAVGAGFFGFSEGLLFGTTPITTAGVVSTAANTAYFGFFVGTSDRIWIVYNLANTFQILYDTGLTLSTVFSTLEMRGFIQNDGSGLISGGYIDLFVDGGKVLRTGTAAAAEDHTFRWQELTLWPATTPIHPTMSVVKTSAAGLKAFQVDYVGSWHSRLLGPS